MGRPVKHGRSETGTTWWGRNSKKVEESVGSTIVAEDKICEKVRSEQLPPVPVLYRHWAYDDANALLGGSVVFVRGNWFCDYAPKCDIEPNTNNPSKSRRRILLLAFGRWRDRCIVAEGEGDVTR